LNLPFSGPPRKRKEVLLLRPLDFRGEVHKVERETEHGIHCVNSGGVKPFFFKWGPAWTFPNLIRFIGVEGTPMTAHPTLEGMKIKISDFLKEVWPPGSYEKLPDKLRNPIETDYGFICGIKATMPDETMDFTGLQADAVLTESDIYHMENFGKYRPKKEILKDLIPTLILIVLSFFTGMLAQMKGWF